MGVFDYTAGNEWKSSNKFFSETISQTQETSAEPLRTVTQQSTPAASVMRTAHRRWGVELKPHDDYHTSQFRVDDATTLRPRDVELVEERSGFVSSQTPPELAKASSWVTVFGVEQDDASMVLTHLAEYGRIQEVILHTSMSNVMHIRFPTHFHAASAIDATGYIPLKGSVKFVNIVPCADMIFVEKNRERTSYESSTPDFAYKTRHIEERNASSERNRTWVPHSRTFLSPFCEVVKELFVVLISIIQATLRLSSECVQCVFNAFSKRYLHTPSNERAVSSGNPKIVERPSALAKTPVRSF